MAAQTLSRIRGPSAPSPAYALCRARRFVDKVFTDPKSELTGRDMYEKIPPFPRIERPPSPCQRSGQQGTDQRCGACVGVPRPSRGSEPRTVEGQLRPWRGQRAAVRLADEAGVKNCVVAASRRAAAILEPTSEEVSTADCRAYAVRVLASALEACSPEMEASRLASSEASAAADATPRRALATLVSTSSGVILAAMSRECWSTTVLRP